MAKQHTSFNCRGCGRREPKWLGKCPGCGEWDTFDEAAPEIQAKRAMPVGAAIDGALARPISEISSDNMVRIPTGIGEFDRVLGKGIVPGATILVGGDPGVGKCLAAEERILDPLSGDFLPITEWAKKNRPVVALNPNTHRLAPQSVSAFFDQGIKPIVQVRTRLGRTIRCTPNHPVLTPQGWEPVNSLSVGTRIASPRTLPYFGSEKMEEHEVRFVAYMLSGGSCRHVSVVSLIPEIAQDLTVLAERFGVQLRVVLKTNSPAKEYRFVEENRREARLKVVAALHRVKEQLVISWKDWAHEANVDKVKLESWQRGECVPTGDALQRLAQAAQVPLEELDPKARDHADYKTNVARLLESLGLRDCKAADKFIPDRIFRLPKEQIATFLKVLFSCGGSVYIRNGNSAGVSYSTISYRLAQDVQHLLLRFGFVVKLRTKHSQVAGEPYVAYELQLLGVPEVKRFLEEIGIWGREAAKQQIALMPEPRTPSTDRDTIPTGPEFGGQRRAAIGNNSFETVSEVAGVMVRNRRHDRPLARGTVAALAKAYTSEFLRKAVENDIYWDEIESITPAGEERVYDISVPAGENFVANDLIVHNSTLLLFAAELVAKRGLDVLYVTGEESAEQVALRGVRLGAKSKNLRVLPEIVIERIIEQIQRLKPALVIVDSIQTVYLAEVASAPGSVSQIREGALKFTQLAKNSQTPVVLIGHVTKDGALAGPKLLEHMVDVVLHMEGERAQHYRLLRAIKNRFGATDEIGVFEMAQQGLVEVPDPSAHFLAERPDLAPGSVVVASQSASRPLLVEVQALVAPPGFSSPRRTADGFDQARVALLLAVLERRAGLILHDRDVFVNVVGGLQLDEPAADLGVALAVASSYTDRPAQKRVGVFGEIGLTGEIRAAARPGPRIKEMARHGFQKIVIPIGNASRLNKEDRPEGAEIVAVKTLEEALEAALI